MYAAILKHVGIELFFDGSDICVWCYMAFILPVHCNKLNITYSFWFDE